MGITRTFLALAVGASLAMPSAALADTAGDPALTVSQPTLDAAIHCHGPALAGTTVTPIVLVTGTGATGEEIYGLLKGAFDGYGHPVCSVDFPARMMGDVQVSAQYLVNAIRYVNSQSGRKVAVYGVSQGGLLPRWALTWWPSLRDQVDDVVAVAGTQHGTTSIPTGFNCSAIIPCPAAFWQQRKGSNLLNRLNAYPDETPGSTSWTTVYSRTDELVKPATGAHPTSALKGATNIAIQAVCAGRKVSHIGTAVDSVSWNALLDAIRYSGPAKASRLPKSTCRHRYATGLDVTATSLIIRVSPTVTMDNWKAAATVPAEPALAPYVS